MIYNKICLMVPTYSRVESLKRLIRSALENAADRTSLCLSLCVNESDTDTRGYLNNADIPLEYDIVYEHTDQPNLALYFNMLYDRTRFSDPETLVSMLGDDMYFLTPGWDARILEEMNKRNGNAIIYCDDNFIAHEKLMVNVFTSRKIVEATEKPFMCPKFHAEMIDVVWTNIGILTGTTVYLSDVKLQHDHQMKIKNPDERDQTCKRLTPLRKLANTDSGQRYAGQYATLCAANMIKNGIGKWNTL